MTPDRAIRIVAAYFLCVGIFVVAHEAVHIVHGTLLYSVESWGCAPAKGCWVTVTGGPDRVWGEALAISVTSVLAVAVAAVAARRDRWYVVGPGVFVAGQVIYLAALV